MHCTRIPCRLGMWGLRSSLLSIHQTLTPGMGLHLLTGGRSKVLGERKPGGHFEVSPVFSPLSPAAALRSAVIDQQGSIRADTVDSQRQSYLGSPGFSSFNSHLFSTEDGPSTERGTNCLQGVIITPFTVKAEA